MSTTGAATSRLESLDQFRGYTVLGMFFVNFVGGFAAIPAIFKHHHTYCSYADAIMPQFLFAVGFAYRLTLLKRLQSGRAAAAYLRVLRRSLGLALVALVLYHLGGHYKTWADLKSLDLVTFLLNWKRGPFETLMHIAVTSIWVIPVIAAGPAVRIAWAVLSGALHVYLSHRFYYQWVNTNPVGIDGGPLGFLTWSIPLLVGSLAYDAVARERGPRAVGRMLAWSAVVMAVGYAVSCLNLIVAVPSLAELTGPTAATAEKNGGRAEPATAAKGASSRGLTDYLVEPPFVPPTRPVNMFTMSQRSGSLSYPTFAAGFSLAIYALFALACDMSGRRAKWVGNLILGALGGVLMSGLVVALVEPYVGRQGLEWKVLGGVAAFLGIWYLDPSRFVVFGVFGRNALAGYVIHDLVAQLVKPYAPGDSPLWYALAATGVYLLICYVFVRHLEKNGIFLRL